MYFFCKTKAVFDFHYRPVIQNRLPGHLSEYLMLVAFHNAGIYARSPVEHRHKIHLKPAVAGSDFPWTHIILFSLFIKRNPKRHIVQLVYFAVKNNHVFTRRTVVAKSIADIETDCMPIPNTVAVSPIPCIIIGPDTSSPVQRAKIRLPAGIHTAFRRIPHTRKHACSLSSDCNRMPSFFPSREWK